MTAHATIHIGCKKLGIDEDDRRDLYMRVTGKHSLTEMAPSEHKAVVGELRRLGFKSKSNGSRKRIKGRFAKKLQALWIGAWNLGLIRNRNDEALIAFVKRQTGIDHVRFVRHPEDAAKAIEALKGWMKRDGGVDWTEEKTIMPPFTQLNGYRIGLAQWIKLKSLDALPGDSFQEYVEAMAGCQIPMMKEPDWIPVMNELGKLIRGKDV